MSSFQIGDRTVGPEAPTFVIAEAGSNHNGDLEMAKELIDAAADAGADAVKFQTFRAESLYVENSGSADYLDDDREVYDIIESMEMPYDWIPELSDHCRSRDVLFMSTPFDERSAEELAEYVPAFKVASYTLSHHPFLQALSAYDKPVVASTGAHGEQEVREAVDVLRSAGVDDLALLHCVAAYPTPLDSINVRAIETLADSFDTIVGLSDHTLDPVVAPSAAVVLGADIVEKHFTLDNSLDGPDHEFALEPPELEHMISHVRKTERALGSGRLGVLEVESELHDIARRRLHATRDIEAGETIDESSVAVLRSGKEVTKGIEPKYFEDIVGRMARREIRKDEGITWDDLAE